MHAAISKVENSAQGLSCQPKFAHVLCLESSTSLFIYALNITEILFYSNMSLTLCVCVCVCECVCVSVCLSVCVYV
jgi:hypothetical protein